MNPAEMVVLIILIVTIGRVLSSRNKYRRGPPHLPQEDGAETAQLRDEVRRLKERVQVLERVVTDEHNSLDLDREIARLRDR